MGYPPLTPICVHLRLNSLPFAALREISVLRFLCLFAAIPLCVFVPLCEILFAYIRLYSRFLLRLLAFSANRQSPFTFHVSPHR
jgi:hypothetical protein